MSFRYNFGPLKSYMKVGFAEKMAKTTATIIVDASTFKMDMVSYGKLGRNSTDLSFEHCPKKASKFLDCFRLNLSSLSITLCGKICNTSYSKKCYHLYVKLLSRTSI